MAGTIYLSNEEFAAISAMWGQFSAGGDVGDIEYNQHIEEVSVHFESIRKKFHKASVMNEAKSIAKTMIKQQLKTENNEVLEFNSIQHLESSGYAVIHGQSTIGYHAGFSIIISLNPTQNGNYPIVVIPSISNAAANEVHKLIFNKIFGTSVTAMITGADQPNAHLVIPSYTQVLNDEIKQAAIKKAIKAIDKALNSLEAKNER